MAGVAVPMPSSDDPGFVGGERRCAPVGERGAVSVWTMMGVYERICGFFPRRRPAAIGRRSDRSRGAPRLDQGVDILAHPDIEHLVVSDGFCASGQAEEGEEQQANTGPHGRATIFRPKMVAY